MRGGINEWDDRYEVVWDFFWTRGTVQTESDSPTLGWPLAGLAGNSRPRIVAILSPEGRTGDYCCLAIVPMQKQVESAVYENEILLRGVKCRWNALRWTGRLWPDDAGDVNRNSKLSGIKREPNMVIRWACRLESHLNIRQWYMKCTWNW